jgi:hypothetical protein
MIDDELKTIFNELEILLRFDFHLLLINRRNNEDDSSPCESIMYPIGGSRHFTLRSVIIKPYANGKQVHNMRLLYLTIK